MRKVVTKFFEFVSRRIVAKVAILIGKFIAKSLQIVTNRTASFVQEARNLLCIDGAVIFEPLISASVSVVDASFDLKQDLASTMIGMIFFVNRNAVAELHFFLEPYAMSLNVGLYDADFANLLIDFVQQSIQRRQVS